jgi:hypothetical protein
MPKLHDPDRPRYLNLLNKVQKFVSNEISIARLNIDRTNVIRRQKVSPYLKEFMLRA